MTLGIVTPASRAAAIPEDQMLVYRYYQAINNKSWDSWLSLLGTAYSFNMKNHLDNEYYQKNDLGVYAIDNVLSVSEIQKIDALEYNSIIELLEGENHEVYLVKTELSVDKENEFYFDGTNYNLIFVGTVNNERKIVGVRLPLVETVEAYENKTDSEAYEIMRFGSDVELQSAANCAYTANPSSIVVCRWRYGDGSCETVDFNKYVKVVTAGEYGYVSRDTDYHCAGAIAVKMYAWYKIVISDPNDAYHVTDTNETDASHPLSYQVYNPGTYWNSSVWGTVYNRVDSVWSYNIYGTGYRRMNTQYRAGYGSGNSGILYQETANDLANQGYGYHAILNYFYGNSGESSGNILSAYTGNHVYYTSTTNSDGSVMYFCKCGYKLVTDGPITIN